MRKKSCLQKSRSAFTLIELLVVISIIGILASLAMKVMDAGQDQEDILASQKLVNDISYAVEAFYAKAHRYPKTLQKDAPSSCSSTHYATDSEGGYLKVLVTGYKVAGGSYAFYDPDPEDVYDNDRLKDAWDQPIEYRICPRNTAYFNKYFGGSSATRNDVITFPGNPKKYNIWSKGADMKDTAQKYKSYEAKGGGKYRAGGKNDAGTDAEDDIGNWN
jgi:prepilin-type N-terminal cleavage/methylation domain-containing protein